MAKEASSSTSSSSSSSSITTTRLVLFSLPFLLHLLSHRPLVLASLSLTVILAAVLYYSNRPRPVLLLDYSCFLPPAHRRLTYELSEYFVRSTRRYTEKSESFMRNIYLRSGLGDETYAPPFVFRGRGDIATLRDAEEEADEGMFTVVQELLSKTGVTPSRIDAVVVACGMFNPVPSLSARLVHRFGFKQSVKTFNIGGMGCSSGVMSVDLAARILSATRKVGYALVVVTESISLNWYFGEDRSMLVTNCIFRVGCAAALVTNDPARRGAAKMELLGSLRTHHGADDASYRAAFQFEDDAGNVGVALRKDLIRVAGEGLREHIRTLGPRVLPISQLLAYAYNVASRRWSGEEGKPLVPDFAAAFDHMCIHTGGKAVIESISQVLNLGDEMTEPARMTLHRFGNTSSSLVFYELAYFEAKGRLKKGDKMWMLAFGTGFKVGSLVWRCIRDAKMDSCNPWRGSIHRYPVKAW